jgi:4-amino-4-deoxy-L-arabinose transferase-like glycosyltransferase
MIILSLITSPVLFRFHSPSTDQMSMIMFTIPIFLYIMFPSKKFGIAFLYGIIYGLSFYTKFMMGLFIFVLIICLFIYIKRLTFKFVLGFLIGLLVPVIIMTCLGYYFWLTIITGQILASTINSRSDISVINLMTKFFYYGPSFLLLFLYLLINSNKLNKDLLFFFIPSVISIFLIMVTAPADWNRYLIHYMPAILLFILSMNNNIELRRRDLLISFLANLVFFELNNYF